MMMLTMMVHTSLSLDRLDTLVSLPEVNPLKRVRILLEMTGQVMVAVGLET